MKQENENNLFWSKCCASEYQSRKSQLKKKVKKNGGQATNCWGASANNQGDKQKNHSWNRNFHKELQDEEEIKKTIIK